MSGFRIISSMLYCKTVIIFFSSFLFLTISASKARRPDQFSGKITVKAKEKSYSKLEIPYQAEVLEGSALFLLLYSLSLQTYLLAWCLKKKKKFLYL